LGSTAADLGVDPARLRRLDTHIDVGRRPERRRVRAKWHPIAPPT